MVDHQPLELLARILAALVALVHGYAYGRLVRLSFRKCDDVRRLRGGGLIRLSQEARRDIPMPSLGSNDGHRFAIVAGQRAFDLTPLPVFKRHTIADRKFKHGLMRVYLMKKAQSLDDL